MPGKIIALVNNREANSTRISVMPVLLSNTKWASVYKGAKSNFVRLSSICLAYASKI